MTSQSHQPMRAPSRGSGYRGLQDCPENDCPCSGLCDECQAALLDHYRHSCGTDLQGKPQELSAFSNAGQCRDSLDHSKPSTLQPDAQASSTPQSSQLLRGACSQERSPAVSEPPSAGGSWPLAARESVCRGCGRSILGIASQDETSSRHTSSKVLFCKAYSNYSIADLGYQDIAAKRTTNVQRMLL